MVTFLSVGSELPCLNPGFRPFLSVGQLFPTFIPESGVFLSDFPEHERDVVWQTDEHTLRAAVIHRVRAGGAGDLIERRVDVHQHLVAVFPHPLLAVYLRDQLPRALLLADALRRQVFVECLGYGLRGVKGVFLSEG